MRGLIMLSVDLSSLWSDQIEEMVKGIDEATINIINYLEYRKSNNFTDKYFDDLFYDILYVLHKYSLQGSYHPHIYRLD